MTSRTPKRPEFISLEGERGLPSVNQNSATTWKRGFIGIFVVGGLLATISFMYISYLHAHKESTKDIPKNIQLNNAVPMRTFNLPARSENHSVSDKQAHTTLSHEQEEALPHWLPLDKSDSDLMISKEDNHQTEKPATATIEMNPQGQGALTGMLNSTATPIHSASILKNRNYLLAKGSFIDCALQTRLDSTVPGMTSCVVTRDIYSDTGKVLLLERGSTVSGEYASDVKQGQARIFVLWNRIKTPNGVVINLDSPGTDSLGGSGVPGYIDNHFWQRFGGALLFSLVQDFAEVAANSTGDNNTTINLGNTANGSQTLASEVLRNTIHIPPTLYKNQGERIGIYIARDLDFKTVYELKPE